MLVPLGMMRKMKSPYTFVNLLRSANLSFRYGEEYAAMHEEVMKLVPTFPRLISDFLGRPEQLRSFFSLVSALHTLITKMSLLIHN